MEKLRAGRGKRAAGRRGDFPAARGGVGRVPRPYLRTKISRAMAESMANSEKPTRKM